MLEEEEEDGESSYKSKVNFLFNASTWHAAEDSGLFEETVRERREEKEEREKRERREREEREKREEQERERREEQEREREERRERRESEEREREEREKRERRRERREKRAAKKERKERKEREFQGMQKKRTTCECIKKKNEEKNKSHCSFRLCVHIRRTTTPHLLPLLFMTLTRKIESSSSSSSPSSVDSSMRRFVSLKK